MLYLDEHDMVLLQGRMLKRAFSKLKLEHVVIEKGQFHQERTKPSIMDEMEVCIVIDFFFFILFCVFYEWICFKMFQHAIDGESVVLVIYMAR